MRITRSPAWENSCHDRNQGLVTFNRPNKLSFSPLGTAIKTGWHPLASVEPNTTPDPDEMSTSDQWIMSELY